MTGDQHAGPDAGRDVEPQLRQRLQDAAQAAPAFDTARWQAAERRQQGTRPIGRGHRPMIAVAAAVLAGLVVIVGGGLWLRLAPGTGSSNGGSSGGGAAGSCAEILSRNHHLYAPYDTVRVPRPGRMLGRAYWCQDTGPANPPDSEVVYALPGVAGDQGFLVRGQIWLRTDLARPPAAIGELQLPVSCRRSGTLSGRIEQFNDHRAGNPVKIRVPYTLGVRADRGLGRVGMQAYDNVRVTVRVTAATQNASAIARLASKAESQSEIVTVDVVCHGDGFVATAIRRR